MKKWLMFIPLLGLTGWLIYVLSAMTPDMAKALDQGPDTTQLTLMFVGDIMGHDSQIAAALNEATGTYDYRPCFAPIAPLLSAPDFTIANLEVTLAGPPFKGYPQFSSPDALAAGLKASGVDALVTANNHSVDRRRQGIERTVKVLDSLEIPRTGTFSSPLDRRMNHPMILQQHGIAVALLNYTYGTNGLPVTWPNMVNLIDSALLVEEIRHTAAIGFDKVIVFMHWGKEYKTSPNSEQKKLAELCLKNGADLVIGSHPHVLQPMEMRQGPDSTQQLVCYSLGNFVSGQRTAPRDGGALLQVTLEKTATGTRIAEAGYFLAWVHRPKDANGKSRYYVLPASQYEAWPDLLDAGAHSKMTAFTSSMRTLMAKGNTGIYEYRYQAQDSAWQLARPAQTAPRRK